MRASLCVLTTCAVLQVTAAAQSPGTGGAISGVIVDSAEGRVTEASVEVVNESKGIRREATSNGAGLFTFTSLPPGDGYSVKISKPGFSIHQTTQIEILIGQNVQLNVKLELSPAQTFTDVIDVLMVEATKTGVSQVVESVQIQNLPINGRRVDSYVLLTPSVVPDGQSGLVSFRGVAAGNAFLTDGNDTTNLFYYENAGRTKITTPISQDAVQEFKVSASGYSAEYGRASGGVINTLTRSGTNALHGTVYWYFRNRTLNARDPYSTYNPPEWRHQAGASVGGPLRKDRLFFFANQEITRRSFPLVASLARAPLFDPSGKFIGTCEASVAQCDAVLRFLDRHYRVLDRRAESENSFLRLDWQPSRRHSFTGTFNYMNWRSPNGERTQAVLTDGSGVGNNADSRVRTQFGRLSWIAVPSATLSFESRFGWFQDRLKDALNESLIPSTGRVQISIAGQGNLGVGADFPRLDPRENRVQFAETARKYAGRHSWTFGGEWIRTSDYRESLSNREGTYSYATFTDFAQDFSGNTLGAKRWQTYSQRFGAGTQSTHLHDFALFLQDQMRASTNLTLNYGFRFEYERLSQPTLQNPDYPETGRIPSPGRNFAPRVGVSYALGSKNVVRVGYGLFFSRIPGGLINTFFLDNGLYQTSVTLDGSIPRDRASGPVFPNRLTAFDPARAYGTSDLTYPSASYRNPFTQQGDIAFERQLSRNIGITVSYLWSRGHRLTTVRDANVGAPGPPVTYLFADRPGSFTTPTYLMANRIDPLWRRVNVVESEGLSYYKAMTIQIRSRLANGFQGSLAYTLSSAVDLNQGGASSNIFFNQGPRSLFNAQYELDKGRSELDQRQRLTITTIWEPETRGMGGSFTRRLTSGWQISQISTFASPQGVSPTVFVAGGLFFGPAFPTTMNGFGGSNRVPFLPPNSLDIDSVIRTDARVTKTVTLTENTRLLLSFEAFNVFNHVSATAVNTQAYQLRNGVLTPTPGLGEGVASGGYPDGTNARRAQVSVRLRF